MGAIGSMGSMISGIIGNFQNGQLISPGKIISDEWEYEGAIVNEKPHGQGKMTWLSGDWCTGTFVNGLAEGPNNTFYDNCSESTYTGTMKAGLKDGRGRAVFKKGDVYEGEYCHGLSCGQGTYKYANGDVYTGGFDQGVAGGDEPALLGMGDHAQCRPVLDGAGRIVALQLDQDRIGRGARQALQAHQRGMADRIGNRGVRDWGHGSPRNRPAIVRDDASGGDLHDRG